MNDEAHQVELPTDTLFWELVTLATRDRAAFRARLAELSPPMLAGLASMFWGHASVFWQWTQNETGCSEDEAEDIGGRLVARGREFFVTAIQEPERLLTAELLDSLAGIGIGIMYEAEKQYLARTGKEFAAACEGPHFDIDDTAYGQLVSDALRS